MSGSTEKLNKLLAGSCCALWCAAWIGGLLVGAAILSLHYMLLGAVGSTVAVVMVWTLCASNRDRHAAQRFFASVVQSRSAEMSADEASELLNQVPAGSSWHSIAAQVQTSLREQSEKLHHAERARALLEVRLKRSSTRQQQIESILAGLTEPVLAVDQYDDVILANPSAERILELTADETGRRVFSNLDRCESLISLLTETRRRKSPGARNSEMELADATGESRWYSVTARSLATTTEGAAAQHGAVAVLRDVSGLKVSQKKNAEFVSAVSHEMKTPLAGIKAYVELLADGDAEDEQTREEFLGVINSQANRLQRLIDNLLNLARIEAGVVEVSKHGRSLNDVLEEAFGIVRPSAEAKRIDLKSDLSGMYLGVFADRDMLMQAAINLLSNAIKYTPEGGTVTLRSRLVDEQIQFEVEDTGVGLSPEDCQRVFEKFYRVKKDREMAQGTGLGLPLAKHLIEDVHGGTLSVASELGRGSTFTVRLPLAGQMN